MATSQKDGKNIKNIIEILEYLNYEGTVSYNDKEVAKLLYST